MKRTYKYGIVHPGRAHRDDVVAVALAFAYGLVDTVYRREPISAELDDDGILILDVGRHYEAVLGNFDHHQLSADAPADCALHMLARDLNIPVIVLSQLNRSAERRENEDKRPQLSDLRESGAIEQDADVVIMLYRAEYYDVDQLAKNFNIGEALVLKNRNGPPGTVKLTFRQNVLCFENISREHDAMAAGG